LTGISMRQSDPLPDSTHADDAERALNRRPPDWRNPEPRQPYHLLVIGAGPAGLTLPPKNVSLRDGLNNSPRHQVAAG
jgi:hypothetical protein